MATLGHEVVGIDTDKGKIASLAEGRPPFYEPEFDGLLKSALGSGLLRFSDDITEAASATVHFICVGTPQKRSEYGADLRFVDSAIASLLPALSEGDLVVGKSTVPVGTAARLQDLVTGS